jgi:antirestriction protein ArdC
MSTPFKPLSEKTANKMVMDLKNGTSIFQMPNNSINSALPFNIESGNRYPGSSALVLLMQKRDDPRWATFNQANRNHTAVLKGATGTFINFMTQYEYQKVFKDGEPVLKENGKQRTEKIRLDEPKEVEAKVFNGEQLRKLEKWEKEPMLLSPSERAQLILDNSNAAIEHGGDDMLYDRQTDTIVLPEMEQFANPEQYYMEALHQLAHRTNALEALDRPQLGNDEGGMISEELRTNLASVFLSKDLNLPYDLNYHVGYVNAWAQLLKEDPAELFKAAEDAQKIVDAVLSFEQKVEEKQEITGENKMQEGRQASGDSIEHEPDAPKFNPERLTKGEVIPHNGTQFKVLAELKNNVYNMEDLGAKRKFKMKSDSGLFASLIEARNNSQEVAVDRAASTEEEAAYHENEAVEQFLDEQYQIER